MSLPVLSRSFIACRIDLAASAGTIHERSLPDPTSARPRGGKCTPPRFRRERRRGRRGDRTPATTPPPERKRWHARRPNPDAFRRVPPGANGGPPTAGLGQLGPGPPASCLSPTDPTLRANPFPEVTDLFCRLPLPTLFYRPEAVHLGDLLRIWVRPEARVPTLPPDFQGPAGAHRTPP